LNTACARTWNTALPLHCCCFAPVVFVGVSGFFPGLAKALYGDSRLALQSSGHANAGSHRWFRDLVDAAQRHRTWDCVNEGLASWLMPT
jgi:hypothetical protein